MSGRSLRRLPVLAHAHYIGSMPLSAQRQKHGLGGGAHTSVTDVTVWLQAMEKVVDAQAIERGRLQHAVS